MFAPSIPAFPVLPRMRSNRKESKRKVKTYYRNNASNFDYSVEMQLTYFGIIIYV